MRFKSQLTLNGRWCNGISVCVVLVARAPVQLNTLTQCSSIMMTSATITHHTHSQISFILQQSHNNSSLTTTTNNSTDLTRWGVMTPSSTHWRHCCNVTSSSRGQHRNIGAVYYTARSSNNLDENSMKSSSIKHIVAAAAAAVITQVHFYSLSDVTWSVFTSRLTAMHLKHQS